MSHPDLPDPGFVESNHGRIRVCFVLSYRAPDYIRGRSLCHALERIPSVELMMAINQSRGLSRYWQAIRRLLEIRRACDPDIYLLGFRGLEIAWLMRCLTRGKPLVLDALMSPYASLGEERKLGLAGKLMAPLWRRYEGWMLRQADAVLTDTQLHSEYYQREFGLPADRIVALPVGAVEALSLPAATNAAMSTSAFRVLFYGSFLPLHGIEVIVDAAARLAALPITFQFIGGTEGQGKLLEAACAKRAVRNYTYLQWVDFDRLLSNVIPAADLCLGGPFGGTPQAHRVVTGKTSQCLALGKATVIGRISENYGFVDRINCLQVEQRDPVALAEGIRWAYDHRGDLPEIGRRGQALYAQRLSTQVIADRLQSLIRRLATDTAAR